MLSSLWVVYHVAGALGIVAITWWVTRGRLPRPGSLLGRCISAGALVFCLGVLVWLGMQTVDAAWRVTTAGVNDPLSIELGRFVREHLPENAVLLCEERIGGIAGNRDPRYEHLTTMFYADRTCYALPRSGADEMARQILQAGGIPYVVSHRDLPLPTVYASATSGVKVYRWR